LKKVKQSTFQPCDAEKKPASGRRNRITAQIPKMNHLFLSLFTFLIMCTQSAFASCTGNSGPALTIPNLSINMNSIPLYGKIGNELTTSATDAFTCNGVTSTPGATIDNRTIYDYSGTDTNIKIDSRSIYKTSEPGIGFAFALEPTNFCSNTIYWAPFATCPVHPSTVNPSTVNFNAKLHIQLYKIGTIKSATNIKLYYIGLRMSETSTTGSNSASYVGLITNTFNLTASTCSLQSGSTTNVTLPAVYANNFASNGGVASNVPFSITVNCPSATNLNITFTDNNNIGQTSNILTNTSTAKGVGVQLSYNGNSISFGPDSADPGTINQIVLNNNLTGSQTFQFNAAYIRTGTITPGSVTAKATFTLSYQ
jgi:type 1 fimbria pilin